MITATRRIFSRCCARAARLGSCSVSTPVQIDAPAVRKAPRGVESSVAKRPYKIGDRQARSIAPFGVHVDGYVTRWGNVTGQMHRYSWIATGPLARDFSLPDDGLRPVTASGIALARAVTNLAPIESVGTGPRRVGCSRRGPRWCKRRGRCGRDGGLPLSIGASARFPRHERSGL
jgi:hypothetical protein